MTSVSDLPPDLPRPVDDGACDHLPGMLMPSIQLPSTAGRLVDLGALSAPRTVIYCYPRTGRPGRPPDWDTIPGARGCTPQTCAFRDRYGISFAGLGAEVYGISTQSTAYQREMAESACTCRSRC